MAGPKRILEIAGREVAISNPGKIYFPEAGITKAELVDYYLAVAPGALRGVRGRPMALKRFVDGAAGEFFFQKRAPEVRPGWVETVDLSFPSVRTAREVMFARCSRAVQELGLPQTPVRTALAKAVRWFEERARRGSRGVS